MKRAVKILHETPIDPAIKKDTHRTMKVPEGLSHPETHTNKERRTNTARTRWAHLARITRPVVDSIPLTEQMQTLTSEVRVAFAVDACVVRELDGPWAVLLAADGLQKERLVPRLHADEGIAREIIQNQRALFVEDILHDPVLAAHLVQPDGQAYLYRSYAGAPLLLNDRVVGMLGVYHVDKARHFSKRDLEHLQIVANHAAVALENDRLFRALQSKTEELETRMAEAKRLEAEREILLADAVDRARRDPLTGLFNHHVFYQKVGAEAGRVRARVRTADPETASASSFVIVLLDVDHFKFFNEAYGHASGDRVLKSVADALQDFCADGDTAARIGGDEFGLLLPKRGPQDLAAIAARLHETVPRTGYLPPGASTAIPIRISVGLAAFPSEGATQNAVVHLADERLRNGKTGLSGNASLNPQSRETQEAQEARQQWKAQFEGFALLNNLMGAVDDKDRYSCAHCNEVMGYCDLIAREMGLSADDAQTLEMAALLHDVGKIGVPDQILRSPAGLGEDAQKNMERHSMLGALLVSATPDIAHLAPLLRSHHERWDGTGYPDGLAGDAIPLLARILSVADGFAAMTSDRPYRSRFDDAAALAELTHGANVQWDKRCVDAFVRAYAARNVAPAESR